MFWGTTSKSQTLQYTKQDKKPTSMDLKFQCKRQENK